MKKLQKILTILIVFFIGMIGVRAEVNFEEQCAKAFGDFDRAFRIIATLNNFHYETAVFDIDDSTYKRPAESELKTRIEKNLSKYSNNYDYNYISTMYNLMKADEIKKREYMQALVNALGDVCNNPADLADCQVYQIYMEEDRKLYFIEYLAYIAELDNFSAITQYTLNQLDVVARACGREYLQKYDDTYHDFYDDSITICDYLSSHRGIQYYVKMALRIISYVSLALALVLCSMDFIKAITSHDDAALTKAFQTSVKRLVAVVVIFLSYMIVQLFLGLITAIPNYDAAQFEICEDLKLGALSDRNRTDSNK